VRCLTAQDVEQLPPAARWKLDVSCRVCAGREVRGLADEALQQVVASGKARYLGFSEWTPVQAAIDVAGPDLHASTTM
jgi:hypothetical protein